MATVFDYLKWRGDLSFAQDPLNPVDGLIFCALSYIPFVGQAAETPNEPIALRDAAADFLSLDDYESRVRAKNDAMMLRAAAETARFGGCKMVLYRDQFAPEEETQFAAMTFLLPDDTAFVAFRGTDRSLVGWKEDFNMAFQYPVPAQATAADYLARVAALWKDAPIVLTGHSKGGNLAVYAAMNASDEVKDRVERIYSLDGPGFPEAVVNSFEYSSVSDRIVKIVPDSSVVGMVLETPERCMVVKSDVEGIMQHFAFSWQMHGGEFDKVEDVANSSVTFNKALNGWLSNLSKEQRERAVDALFAVLEASGAGSISAMMAAGPKVIPEMLGTYVGLSVEDRRNLNQALGIMLQAALARNPKVRRR